MTPQALEKLRRKHGGHWPSLRDAQADTLVQWAREILEEQPSNQRTQFWGLIDSVHPQPSGSVVLHCFNHSTRGTTFPWQAEAVGFGHRVPVRITASGTILAKKTFRTPWHSMDSAFLVFQVSSAGFAAVAAERLEPGMILTHPGTARLRRTLNLAALPGMRWHASDLSPSPVILSHWLSRPVEAILQPQPPQDLLTASGIFHKTPLATLTLETPIIADPGWVVAIHPPGHPRALTHAVVLPSTHQEPEYEI
jgi:hypothetical protein